MLMDCEYYHQLFLQYGKPFVLPNILISNRTHKHQISSTYSGNLNDEIKYDEDTLLYALMYRGVEECREQN